MSTTLKQAKDSIDQHIREHPSTRAWEERFGPSKLYNATLDHLLRELPKDKELPIRKLPRTAGLPIENECKKLALLGITAIKKTTDTTLLLYEGKSEAYSIHPHIQGSFAMTEAERNKRVGFVVIERGTGLSIEEEQDDYSVKLGKIIASYPMRPGAEKRQFEICSFAGRDLVEANKDGEKRIMVVAGMGARNMTEDEQRKFEESMGALEHVREKLDRMLQISQLLLSSGQG